MAAVSFCELTIQPVTGCICVFYHNRSIADCVCGGLSNCYDQSIAARRVKFASHVLFHCEVSLWLRKPEGHLSESRFWAFRHIVCKKANTKAGALG